jgi:hypothetical protein
LAVDGQGKVESPTQKTDQFPINTKENLNAQTVDPLLDCDSYPPFIHSGGRGETAADPF